MKTLQNFRYQHTDSPTPNTRNQQKYVEMFGNQLPENNEKYTRIEITKNRISKTKYQKSMNTITDF